MMSAVQELIAELVKRGLRAEWISTGGGCMAVSVRFGEFLPGEDYITRYNLLITNREDAFWTDDYRSDADLFGFYVGFYAYTDDGEYSTDGVCVYETPDGAGVSSGEAKRAWDEDEELRQVVALSVELAACTDAVEFIAGAVEAAEKAWAVETLSNQRRTH